MSIHPVCAHADIQLPNELLSIIIDELASDSVYSPRKALASCRLASHVLYSLATAYFLPSLVLTQFGYLFPGQARGLIQLLSNQDVAASVHTLTLRCGQELLENSQTGTFICQILNCLPRIRNFTFDCVRKSLIPTNVYSAIQACTSPNLTTLDLSYIASFPITFITTCPKLRRLSLKSVEFNFDVDPMDETSRRQPVCLDSLKIDEASIISLGTGLSSNKSFAKYFSGIRNLQIGDMFRRTTTVFRWDMILLASQTLTTLDLSMPAYSTSFPADSLENFPFDLAQFPALRHFKVQLPNYSHVSPTLPLMRQLLSTSSSSGLVILEIIITWFNVENEQIVSLFTLSAEWVTLDEILSSDKFVSLKKVVLDLTLDMVDYFGSEHEKMALLYANKLFPTFQRHRTLETNVGLYRWA